MSETLITLLQFGFGKLNLHSIEANINPNNNKSKKLLLNIGFRKEALFIENYFHNNKYMNSEVYSLLESNFNSK
jgi:ribosomal-protein-alanine N-acetyltransferase